MSFLQKIFGKKSEEEKVGGMQDFMTLVRVYFQASLATNVGITNIAMLPDLRVFKSSLHVATVNNKLGLGEKNHCKKMMKELYNMNDSFFKEIDKSIAKNCRKLQDVNTYLIQFQGFSQDLMMLMGNLMKFKLRIPGFFKKALRTMVENQVNDLFTKNDWKDASTLKTVAQLRQYNKHLGFSEQWMSEFVYNVVMLAKKEPKPSDEDVEKAKAAQK